MKMLILSYYMSKNCMLFCLLVILFGLISTYIIIQWFQSSREGFESKRNIVLMGDSVLNNSNYVPADKSVFAILKSKTNNVTNFATDGAVINTCLTQLEQIPTSFNNDSTYLFISAGGNDILNSPIQLDQAEIAKLFDKYIDCIKAIKHKLPSANLNILNLYLPANPKYKSYKTVVDMWNQLILSNATTIGLSYNVIDTNKLLVGPKYFVYGIEPSASASKTLAEVIYNNS